MLPSSRLHIPPLTALRCAPRSARFVAGNGLGTSCGGIAPFSGGSVGVGRFVAPVLPPPWRPAVVQTTFLVTSSAQMMEVGTVGPGEGQQTAAEPTPN